MRLTIKKSQRMVSKGKYPKEGIQRMAFIVIYSAHGIRVHESKGYSDRIGNTGNQ